MDTTNKSELERINKKLFNETAKERNIPSYYIGSVYGYEST